MNSGGPIERESNQDIVQLLHRMKRDELEEQSRLLKENDLILTKIN